MSLWIQKETLASPFPCWECWPTLLHHGGVSSQQIPSAVAPLPFPSGSGSPRGAASLLCSALFWKWEISDTLQLAEGFGKVIVLEEL